MNIKSRLLIALIYPFGDLTAQLILQEFNLYRTISLCFLAFTFYQWEIPQWFKILDATHIKNPIPLETILLNENHKLNWLGRTIGAIIYFNPLWIARHMFFIALGNVGFNFTGIGKLLLSSLTLGFESFLLNLPISILGNYLVQVKLNFKYRFLGSAILTCLLTICYALAYSFL